MYLRPKTKRRVTVLLLIGAILFGGGSIAVSMRLHRVRARRAAGRALAMQCYQGGDFFHASRFFDRYLAGTDNADAPALYADGVAHLHLAGTGVDDTELLQARLLLTRDLQLDPANFDAQHALLQTNRQLGFDNDVLLQSRSLLALNPRDPAALQAEVDALAATGQYALAEQASVRLNALQPHDVVAQSATLRLMHLAGEPAVAILDRAGVLLASAPADPAFQLLRGLAAIWANQPQDAAAWLGRAAAGSPSLQAPAILLLSDAFDRIDHFADAADVLARASTDRPADVSLRFAELLRRWQQGDTAAVRAALQDCQPTDPRADARLLALRGLADAQQNDAIAAALQARTADPAAAVWGAMLGARSVARPPAPADAIALCQTAMHRDPSNPVTADELGTIEASVEEDDLALRDWAQAAQLAPGWAGPHERVAALLAAAGRSDAAAVEADAARRRNPAAPPLLATSAGPLPHWPVAPPDPTPASIALAHPATAADWAQLSAAHADDAAVQHAALDAPIVWTDRVVVRTVIDRLHHLTGDGGLEWRMARVRLLLSPPFPTQADLDAAVTLAAQVARLAPGAPRPLLLWADALQRAGDRAAALEHLRAAATLDPHDPAIAARLNAATTAPGR